MKVGDYVRTKYGITQYREYEINNCGLIRKMVCMPVKSGENGIFANSEDVIKSSPNIIDLIQKGDYVNGREVYYTVGDLVVFDGGQDGEIYIKNKEIKTVVTKEQMEAMQYRVEK